MIRVSHGFPAAEGVRLPWEQLPIWVREGVEAILGSPVVAAVSQPGGFSPGAVLRVRTQEGARAFVKAVGPEPNPESPALHRREARVMAQLPSGVPVPRLLGCVDQAGWVALVLEEIQGRQPELP